jgi:protein phosphatase
MNHYERSEIDRVLPRTFELSSAALTQGGKECPENKDAVFEHTTQADSGECVGLYIVCDGFGDNEMEHTASQLAIQTIVAELGRVFTVIDSQADPTLTQPSPFTLYEWLRTAVGQANEKVWLCNQLHHLIDEAALGTTLTLALIHGDIVRIANVGDSRTYVWRAGELTQITRDHSVITELAEAGFLSEAEAANYPRNKAICRALGPQPGVEVDMFEWKLQTGDKLLLCSDGLWRSFPETTELNDWLSANMSPEDLCWQLVAEASYRDDFDDISVVIVQAADQPKHYLEEAAQAYEPLFTETAVPVPATLVS